MQVAIDKLSDVLYRCPHFDRILTLCSAQDAYLAGGAIRDALIGRQITDLDLIFPNDPTSLARTFARQIGGNWFWLDKQRLQSRVVVKHNSDCLHYDFALFRAPDLEGDLLDRDFTINALALPLATDLSGAVLIDPCRGLEDLQQDSLCMVSSVTFSNDPLRIIKGVRHATVLGLEIESDTLHAMQQEVAGLDRIALERVRQEIWKIFADEHAARGLQLLYESGVGELLFGKDFYKSIQKLTERLDCCRNEWQRLADSNPVVSDWLAEEVEQGLCNETLLLYTLLLASIDCGLPGQLAKKWLLSRKSRSKITAVVALNQVALNDFTAVVRSSRAYAWWAARHNVDPKLLLLALAVVACTFEAGSASTELQPWVPLVASLNEQRPNDLVDGHWLRSELHLKDGPEMTKALELLRNAEIYGQISNNEEARLFLVKHYQNRIDKVNFDTL